MLCSKLFYYGLQKVFPMLLPDRKYFTTSFLLDKRVLAALTDETTRAILLKVMGLSQVERTAILRTVQEFEGAMGSSSRL